MVGFIRRHWRLTLTILLALIAASAGAFAVARPMVTRLGGSTPGLASPVSRPLKVYVSGAVVRPGVYELSSADRVEDAVRAAGGPTADADLERINLAVRLRDEMQVHVPRRLPAGQTRLSINRATAAELEALPGIGPVTAARIVDYRTKNGPFTSIEQLRDLRLVSAATFERIKELIEP